MYKYWGEKYHTAATNNKYLTQLNKQANQCANKYRSRYLRLKSKRTNPKNLKQPCNSNTSHNDDDYLQLLGKIEGLKEEVAKTTELQAKEGKCFNAAIRETSFYLQVGFVKVYQNYWLAKNIWLPSFVGPFQYRSEGWCNGLHVVLKCVLVTYPQAI